MIETTGIQIDPRCIKCGRYPGPGLALYEMRNHLYICADCRQQEEQQGRTIAWVAGAGLQQVELPALSFGAPSPATRPIPQSLPSDSLFAVLGVKLTATAQEVEDALLRKMADVLRQADSPEKLALRERLDEWQREIATDDTWLDQYRKHFQPKAPSLTVGGRQVFTAVEFAAACETSAGGWADGVRLLKNGALESWLLNGVGDRGLAKEARDHQSWKTTSDFRALNQLLYRLNPERPFRLYGSDQWQPITAVPSATSLVDLASLCDAHWQFGERNLYDGAMIAWMEKSRGVTGALAYFKAAAERYATSPADRGLGLELLLEYAIPTLTRPKLIVTFNDSSGEIQGRYEPKRRWDRELAHKPVTITVTNATRGYTHVDLSLVQPSHATEPAWAALPASTITVAGRPGANLPFKTQIVLSQLEKLNRGHTYRRILRMAERRAANEQPIVSEFPVSLKTMWLWQGFRGLLWFWGLRGNLPGFIWSAAIAALAALPLVAAYPATIPHGRSLWLGPEPTEVTANTILQAIQTGVVRSDYLALHGISAEFSLIFAGVLGVIGFLVGFGKGHRAYTAKQSAAAFRAWAFWLAIALAAATWRAGEGAVTALYVFAFACLLAFVRRRFESFLIKRHVSLLNPPARG